MIQVHLKRLNDAFHFEAVNDNANAVHIDASPEIGGSNQGMRPMQMVLAALGGCSAIDVINILRKQKQDLRDISVDVKGEREQGAIPSLYREVHVHFSLTGPLDPEKTEKAVGLAVEKYCSVAKTLEPTARVTYSFEIVAIQA